MALVRCNRCVGTGEIMGGGMMMQDCVACDGSGKIDDSPVPDDTYVSRETIDRRSKTYKEAINGIMDLHSCDKEEAVRIFDDEFSKLDA
jgi:RecJ-like exonuclease